MANLVRIVVHAWLKNAVASVDGLENVPAHGPYLLAPNHIDYLDGYYILAALYGKRPDTIHYLSQTNNYWWAGFVHPVKWDDREATIQETVHMLKKGFVVCNFPEGKRNDSAVLLAGKTGTVRMALAAGVPIIPVGLRGPSGASFNDSVRLARDPAGRSITFGKPWKPTLQNEQLTEQSLSRLTSELMHHIADLCGKNASV